MRLVVEFGARMLVKYQSAGPTTRLAGVRGIKNSGVTVFGSCAERKCRSWEMIERERLRDFD